MDDIIGIYLHFEKYFLVFYQNINILKTWSDIENE